MATAMLMIPVFAVAQSPKAQTVHQIFLEDQADRGVDATKGAGLDLDQRDAQRRDKVRLMIDNNQLVTAQDFHDAAFIFQHGAVPDDYLLAHILAMTALSKGDRDARWIAAATLDRYLQSVKQPQVFGTQYGETQDPYNRGLLTDSLRLTFCVPEQAKQAAMLEYFKKGPYPPESLRDVPGCTR
jgi:hypothetical protein